MVYRHLRGKDPLGEDVVGVYPMLPDETCRFLVADFDDESWREDVSSLWEICHEYGLDVAVERSRSGSGAHVWFFFSEPVSCSLARKLASIMLTLAMERRHDLGFKSYDRLLPNQDTMPSGGFGNLIALPFQGLAAKSGNSLFVDDDFIPYDDQWAYLSMIEKITSTQTDELFAQLGGNELGTLAIAEDQPDKPWEKTSATVPLTRNDFPAHIQITRANGLYIPKHGVSERALNRIKRLAAFKNPEFNKAQAMRMSTYDKERIICRAEETASYIHLPRGLEPELIALFASAELKNYEIADETQEGRMLNISFAGELRGEQLDTAEALLEHSNGVLAATTAFGKTVVAASLISRRKVNTLVLVHTQALMNQWKSSLERFLLIDEALPEQPKTRGRKKRLSHIGCLGGGKDALSGIVDIAIIGSLFDDGEVRQFVKDYGMVIADECHHVSSIRYEDVMSAANARYVYGLTATPARQDGRHPIIFQQCGPIRYRVDAKEQALARGFSHSLIPRFTRFRKPLSLGEEAWPISDIYNALAENNARNDYILRDVDMALERRRTPLILTERVPHAKMLAERIREQNPNLEVFLLIGEGTASGKKELLEAIRGTPDNKQFVIVATGKYVGEGFDEPRLDTLFVAMPIAWKGTVTQYAGRLHRICEGKEEVIVYDYVDINVPVLERMYHKRLAAYASLGYTVKGSPMENEIHIGAIYNQQSFFSVFAHDLEHAQKEVLIVSPYLSKGRVSQMKKLFLTAILNGARGAVITRPAEAFSPDTQAKVTALIQDLKNGGVKVIQKDNIHQKFAVIDYRVVWYGSINFLSYGKSEESVMRFENEEIAGELLEGLE